MSYEQWMEERANSYVVDESEEEGESENVACG